MKKSNFLIFLLVFILCVNFTYAQNLKNQKKEKLKATAIAQYSFPLCVYHPCYVELIVRLDEEKHPSYARVIVEYFPIANLPNRGFPVELTDRTKKWKFNAIRDASKDAPIPNYSKMIDFETGKDVSEEVAAPAWKLLPGAEGEKIPVGAVLPYYFVESRGYKEVRR